MAKEQENKNRIDKLENRIESIVDILDESTKIQKEHLGITKSQQEINKSFLEGFSWLMGSLDKFQKNFGKIILLILALIYREELGDLFIWFGQTFQTFWNGLSENWQIALFSSLVLFVIFFLGIYLGKTKKK